MKDGIKLEKVIAENGRFSGYLKLHPFKSGMGFTAVYLNAEELRELAAMALAIAHELEAAAENDVRKTSPFDPSNPYNR